MTALMFGLSGLLGIAGVLLLMAIVVAAFRNSFREGALSLFVPGYVLFYGWRRMKKPLLPAGALAAFLAAGAAGFFSTAFEPNLTIEDDGGMDEGFDDLDPP